MCQEPLLFRCCRALVARIAANVHPLGLLRWACLTFTHRPPHFTDADDVFTMLPFLATGGGGDDSDDSGGGAASEVVAQLLADGTLSGSFSDGDSLDRSSPMTPMTPMSPSLAGRTVPDRVIECANEAIEHGLTLLERYAHVAPTLSQYARCDVVLCECVTV